MVLNFVHQPFLIAVINAHANTFAHACFQGYAPAPAMYNAPPAAGENVNVPPSAADPLLNAPVAASAPAPAANGTYTFQIDGDKTSSNFL